jgi:carboxylesterase
MTMLRIGIPIPAAWQVGVGLGAITASASAWALLPVSTRRLRSQPQPSATYAEALTRWQQVQQADDHTIHPVARSRLLTHGAPTECVAILLHGVTNCPQQFMALGRALFDRGYTVLIPRMPRNGLLDRHTDELKHLRAPELRRFIDTVVDIAAGLGAQVTIVGLSAGGILAAWAAQQRREIHRAVVIAPSFGILRMSPLQHTLVRNVFSRLPAINPCGRAPYRAAKAPTHLPAQQQSRGRRDFAAG